MSLKKKGFSLFCVLLAIALMAGCTKQLMPPEIEATGSVADSELEEVADSSGAEQGFVPEDDYPIGGTAGNNDFAADPNTMAADETGGFDESDFVREESLSETGVAEDSSVFSDAGDTTGSDSMAMGSDSASGSFADENPFASGTDSSQDQFASEDVTMRGSDSMMDDNGIDEARLYSFRPTSELKDVHFEFDKYDLDDRSKSVLKQNADFLKQHPNVKVEIQGHCDERGTNNYNLALGQRRADSTKRYLASLGISENRLHVISYGEEKPFCLERNEGCWWRNRRAHFMVAE